MKVRRLIASSSIDQETAQVILRVFDRAWREIAPHFNGDRTIERAQLKLAYALLALAPDNISNEKLLKDDALHVMSLAYDPERTG